MLSASWVTLDFVAIGSVLHATRQVTNRDVNTMLDKTTNKEY
jgi:predicted phosphoribosyltransferase